jgi:DNA-binding response OmpR family regulator
VPPQSLIHVNVFSSDPDGPLETQRVLLVDPREASRVSLRSAVQALGCRRIALARSYAEAINLLSGGGGFDIILCEYLLDGARDGQQLLEELRSQQIISMRTAFVMVTAESSARRVVAAAEFTPDDFIVKPFSVDQLIGRLSRIVRKRQILAPVYERLEQASYAAAVEECMAIGWKHPTYEAECAKLASDLLIANGDYDAAEELLDKLLASKDVPWAVVSLARLKARKGDLERAAEMVERMLCGNPDFLAGHDALADIFLRRGEREAALRVMKAANARSDANVSRMRRLATLAEDLGDLPTAEQVFSKVLDRTRDSRMLSGEDYANLSRLLVAQGKFDRLDQLALEQRRKLKGHRDSDLASALLDYHRAERGSPADREAAVKDLIEIEAQDIVSECSPRLVAQVVSACLNSGKEQAGFRIAARLAKRATLDPVVLSEVQEVLDRYRAQQARDRARVNDKATAAS